MSFRPTEYTVRQLLIEELRRRGVKVTPEISFVSPVGRLVPDLLLQNGGSYVVETKLGAESKLMNAVLRLYDYSKFAQARGAFAILFPEELRRPWPAEVLRRVAADSRTQYTVMAIFRDFRPSQSFRGNLSEVADWIAGHVLRVPVVEADTGLAIRVLREAVDFVSASVRMLKGEELEDIFGGRSVFENILQYEDGRYPVEQMREAATYLLINQLLFYHVLSSIDASFPGLDEDKIERPADLARYFEPVLRRNYSSIFGFDVASRLPEKAVDVIRKVVMVIKALAPERIRHDVLGKVFHELIPFEVRKAVAAFYTNNEAAEILAQLAIDRYDAKVMDLAVGSGTLLVAAYRRKRELLKKEKGFVDLEKMHRRFLEEDLTGIDIMPFAAHLAVVHLSLQGLLAGFESEKIRIAVWDSTELKPGDTIPAISKELKLAYRRPTLEMFMKGKPSEEEAYVRKGVVTLEGMGGEEIKLEKADVVIMNPPFTRQERLPKEYKETLIKRLSEYRDCIHGQLGLYGYFILLADRFTKQSGRIALVLPATVLRVESARKVRELLVKNYCIEHIITAWERAAFSEGAQFREILLVAKKGSKGDSKCVITALKKLPSSTEEARQYAQMILSAASKLKSHDLFKNDVMIVRVMTQNEIKEKVDNLFALISTYDLKVSIKLEEIFEKISPNLVTLKEFLGNKGEIFEFDYRPPYHGAFIVKPFRAIKTIDQWIIKEEEANELHVENRFTKESFRIPLKALKYGLRRPARTELMDLTNELDYVIISKFNGLDKFLKSSTVIERWQRYASRRLANLLVSRRFDISAYGTRLIAFYTDNPAVGVDMWSVKGIEKEDAKILALWFNSTLNLLYLLVHRTETRGAWMKIHEYMLKETYVPNLRKIPKKKRDSLLHLFDKVRNVSFPSIVEQLKNRFWAREAIDKTFLRILGFNEKEIEETLNFLYPALANEIEQLKALMRG